MFRFNTQLRPAGIILIHDPEESREIEQATLMCCHCGAHFSLLKYGKTSLGTVPGTCWTCGGQPVCGKQECMQCVPNEVQLSNMEAGRSVLAPRPVMVSIGSSIPS